MFNQGEVPPKLWPLASAVNDIEGLLWKEIAGIQSNCQHVWSKITWCDPNYTGRLDHRDQGQHNVIKGFHCAVCNAYKPFTGLPFEVCFLCGGKMKIDRYEQCDGLRIMVHKCQDCGHEHDTT